MKESKKVENEVNEILESKSDKSDISYDQNILDKMIELKSSGNSKDDVMFEIQTEFGVMKPSLLTKYWTKSGCSVSSGSGYRQRTVEMFLDTNGELTQKEWEDEMISGGYLKKIVNYRQHFATYYHLYHHTPMV